MVTCSVQPAQACLVNTDLPPGRTREAAYRHVHSTGGKEAGPWPWRKGGRIQPSSHLLLGMLTARMFSPELLCALGDSCVLYLYHTTWLPIPDLLSLLRGSFPLPCS